MCPRASVFELRFLERTANLLIAIASVTARKTHAFEPVLEGEATCGSTAGLESMLEVPEVAGSSPAGVPDPYARRSSVVERRRTLVQHLVDPPDTHPTAGSESMATLGSNPDQPRSWAGRSGQPLVGCFETPSDCRSGLHDPEAAGSNPVGVSDHAVAQVERAPEAI